MTGRFRWPVLAGTTAFLALAGLLNPGLAWAQPAPVGPENGGAVYPPPPATDTSSGTSFSDQLQWMVLGALVLILFAALVGASSYSGTEPPASGCTRGDLSGCGSARWWPARTGGGVCGGGTCRLATSSYVRLKPATCSRRSTPRPCNASPRRAACATTLAASWFSSAVTPAPPCTSWRGAA